MTPGCCVIGGNGKSVELVYHIREDGEVRTKVVHSHITEKPFITGRSRSYASGPESGPQLRSQLPACMVDEATKREHPVIELIKVIALMLIVVCLLGHTLNKIPVSLLELQHAERVAHVSGPQIVSIVLTNRLNEVHDLFVVCLHLQRVYDRKARVDIRRLQS